MLKFAVSMFMAGLMSSGWAYGQNGILTTDDDGDGFFGFLEEPLDRPFMPDRPRFRSSHDVVPVGRFTIEAGANYSFDDEYGVEVSAISGPDVLLRTGIVPRLEGRVGWGGYQEVEVDTGAFTDDTKGATDMSVGLKFDVVSENQGAVPALVLVGEVSLPVGDDDFTSDRVDPSLELAFDYDEIDDIFGVSGGVRVASLENPADEEDYVQTGASVSFDQEWSQEIETFLEYFAFFNSDSDIDDAHFLQTGGIITIVPNFTLDAKVGVGLTSESSDFFAGAGASVSF